MYEFSSPTEQRHLDANCILWMFAGTLFLFFNFRVMGFNIIPNFIGYILIFVGLRRMEHNSRLLRKAKYFALIGLVLSLPGIYTIEYPLGQAPLWLMAYSLMMSPLSLIANLLLLYYLLYGIADLARQASKDNIAQRSRSVFIVKAFSSLMGSAIAMSGILIPAVAAVLAIPVIVVAFIIEIIYLFFLWRAHKALNGAVLN
jgi:hypothetical protein